VKNTNPLSIKEIREIARQCIPEDPGKTARQGIQLDEHWLPEPLKKLLIEEHNRPDDERQGIAIIKYFNPQGAGTWWISELDPEHDIFFGLCSIQEKELGTVSLKELREYRGPFLLGIERDYYFEPTPLNELM